MSYYEFHQCGFKVLFLNRLSMWGLPTDEKGNDTNGVLAITEYQDEETNEFNLLMKNRYSYE